MAYPFGGHPTLRQYIEWCVQYHEVTATSGFIKKDGISVTFHKLKLPSGKRTVVSGVSMTEHLTPTMVSYLDRRLGVASPFPSLVSYD